ncbi:MAG: DUF370 domain-containing protein [Ruminococcaceae bacterium]|nr:DUF370 domain-containing protein [Oscillospiraceae bacterium]
MYIHLGNKKNIREKDIIGIFDMDKATMSKVTQKFLNKKEKENNLIMTIDELPKSLILTDNKVYMSQLSPNAIYGRLTDKEKI